MSLLIYIPTYNRPNQVRNILVKLYEEIESTDPIKVIISDNCSSNLFNINNISEKVDFSFKIGQLEILHNSFNLGMSHNILQGFKLGIPYDWIWILADDDDLLPGFKSKIFSNISDCDIDIVGVKFGEKLQRSTKYIKQNEIVNECTSSKVFNSYIFLSNTIYQTNAVKNHLLIGYENSHTYVPHFLILLGSLKEDNKVLKLFDQKLVNYIVPELGYSYWKVAGIGVGAIKNFDSFSKITSRKKFYKIFFQHNDFKVILEIAFNYLILCKETDIYRYYSLNYLNSLTITRNILHLVILRYFIYLLELRLFFKVIIKILMMNKKISKHIIEMKIKYEK